MKCQKCNTREATENWLGEGSTMDYIHGNYQRWCKRCCLEEQIKHCEKELNELPERINKFKEELERMKV